jgi:cellulose synthase operon protein C
VGTKQFEINGQSSGHEEQLMVWRQRNRGQQQAWGLALGIALVLPGLGLARPVSAQTGLPSEVRQGYTQLGKNQVDDALKTFEGAVARYPSSAEAYLGLAIAARRLGKDQLAWDSYQKVLQLDGSNLLALKSIGLLGGYRPEWQVQGIEALDRLLAIQPNDDEARGQRALLLGYQQRFAAALTDYQRLLQGKPSNDILLGAAQVYTYSGDFLRAIDLFNRYQTNGGKISPNAAIAYGRALRKSGAPSQAVALIQGQLSGMSAINETTIQLRAELAQAYLDNNQGAEALAALDPLKGRREARLPLARALNEIGQRQGLVELLAESASLYKAVLSDTPTPTPLLVREVADVLSGIPQERPAALSLFRQLASQQPGDRILQLQLLALENQLGLVSRMQLLQRLQPIITPLPQEPSQQLAIARALIPIDPDPSLLPVYQALLAAEVPEPFLNFRIAQLLIDRGDFGGAQEAIAVYRSTPSGAQDLAPELLLAEIDRRLGNLEGSANRYLAVLSSQIPDNDVKFAALKALAGIRFSQRRIDESLALYDRLIAANPQDLQLVLARTAIAYPAGRVTAFEAEQVLNSWLQLRPNERVPELYSLVAALPADPRREGLYAMLAEADPSNVPVQVRWIEVLASYNPYLAQAQANRLLAQARRIYGQGDPALYLLQGQLALAAGNLDVATQAYETVLAQQPDNTTALSGLGGIRFQQRRFESATQYYSRVLSLNPDDTGAQLSMAELLAAQGRKLDALQQFEQFQRQTPIPDRKVNQRVDQIQEEFLQQRGFQPSWERY